MGRQPGGIYRNRQGTLRYKYTFKSGDPRVWDKAVPAPDDGSPLDEEWGDIFISAFRRKVKAGWDPRQEHNLPTQSTTVGEYITNWIKAQTYEDATRDAQRLVYHLLPSALAQMPITEVKPRHCLAYVQWLKARPSRRGGTLAPRTIRTIAQTVQRALSQAVRDEIISVSPWNLPPNALPGIEDKELGARDTWIFTYKEVQALSYSKNLNEDRRAMWATLFLGCCRTGELVALRVKDWDRNKEPLGSLSINKSRSALHKRIKSTKTKRPRLVPVHPALQEILESWVSDGLARQLGRQATPEDLLFPSPATGEERAGNSILKLLHSDLSTLGYRSRRAHDTRRTHISMLVDSGASKDIYVVWTHGKKKDVLSGYTTESWKTFCREMLKLEFGRPQSAIGNAISIKETALNRLEELGKKRERDMGLELRPESRSALASAPFRLFVSQPNVNELTKTHQDSNSAIQIAIPLDLYTGEALAQSFLDYAEASGVWP